MRILGTHHIALYTSNFERLRDFYVHTLGLPVVGAIPEHRILFIEVGSTTIELSGADVAAPEAEPPGWNHLALEVENVDEEFAALEAQGVWFHVLPENFPAETPSYRIAFFRDPDGNAIELIQPLGGRFPQSGT